jgi:hypothetical protein
MDRSLVKRSEDGVERVVGFVAELAAADGLIAELVAENDQLRAQVERLEASAVRGAGA